LRGGKKLVELFVDKQAYINFSNFFGPIIKEQITTFYNPDFLINFASRSYSFSFLQEEIIIFILEGKNILDIKRADYKELIPDSFLTDLLSLEILPSRVRRYKQIGKERLRQELADELRIGGITAENTTVLWDNYPFKIGISPELKMEIIKPYFT